MSGDVEEAETSGGLITCGCTVSTSDVSYSPDDSTAIQQFTFQPFSTTASVYVADQTVDPSEETSSLHEAGLGFKKEISKSA